MNTVFFNASGGTNRPVTVYGLIASDEYFIRYIGQTVSKPKQRLSGHRSVARRRPKTPVGKWMKKVLDRGATIRMQILQENAIWDVSEKLIIAFHRELGGDLLNLTAGGEGTLGFHNIGTKRPDLAAANIARRGLPGRPRMPGETERLMTFVRGSKRPWVSERNRLSKGKAGRKHSDETRAAIGARHKGKVVSLETRQKLSASGRGHCTERQRINLAIARAAKTQKRLYPGVA